MSARKTEPYDKKFACPQLLEELEKRSILVDETNGTKLPDYALMHNWEAPIPQLVISPRSEWGVAETLRLIKHYKLDSVPLSVRSGGHGYFCGASCDGIMINLAFMNHCEINGNTLSLQTGCILSQIIDVLSKNKKAVPHGDCFGVGAGGHFLTAGWDFILSRKQGLGCQQVVGGTVVLWDGTVINVDKNSCPDVLWAMRGGAIAEIGIATQIKLEVFDEPTTATWLRKSISKEELRLCVENAVFSKAIGFSGDVSLSFVMHGGTNDIDPVCLLVVYSLRSPEKTIDYLGEIIPELLPLLNDLSDWYTGSLLDMRMLPASDFVRKNPQVLGEMTAEKLHNNPRCYWETDLVQREMEDSYIDTVSSWITAEGGDGILLDIYEKMQMIQDDKLSDRMYFLMVTGSESMKQKQTETAMPLGYAMARFEVHWNQQEEAMSAKNFTRQIYEIIKKAQDCSISRPYRGDIWKASQKQDSDLQIIFKKYNKRSFD